MLSIAIYYIIYYIIGPPSYIRSVVDRNVVMRPIPIHLKLHTTRKECAVNLTHKFLLVKLETLHLELFIFTVSSQVPGRLLYPSSA